MRFAFAFLVFLALSLQPLRAIADDNPSGSCTVTRDPSIDVSTPSSFTYTMRWNEDARDLTFSVQDMSRLRQLILRGAPTTCHIYGGTTGGVITFNHEPELALNETLERVDPGEDWYSAFEREDYRFSFGFWFRAYPPLTNSADAPRLHQEGNGLYLSVYVPTGYAVVTSGAYAGITQLRSIHAGRNPTYQSVDRVEAIRASQDRVVQVSGDDVDVLPQEEAQLLYCSLYSYYTSLLPRTSPLAGIGVSGLTDDFEYWRSCN